MVAARQAAWRMHKSDFCTASKVRSGSESPRLRHTRKVSYGEGFRAPAFATVGRAAGPALESLHLLRHRLVGRQALDLNPSKRPANSRSAQEIAAMGLPPGEPDEAAGVVLALASFRRCGRPRPQRRLKESTGRSAFAVPCGAGNLNSLMPGVSSLFPAKQRIRLQRIGIMNVACAPGAHFRPPEAGRMEGP